MKIGACRHKSSSVTIFIDLFIFFFKYKKSGYAWGFFANFGFKNFAINCLQARIPFFNCFLGSRFRIYLLDLFAVLFRPSVIGVCR